MFDFLSSKKDNEKRRELEENIAEIRKKVQQEERRRRSGNGDEFPQEVRDPEPPLEREHPGDGPDGGWEPEPPERLARDESDAVQEASVETDRTRGPRSPTDAPTPRSQPARQDQQTGPSTNPRPSQESTVSRAQDTTRSQQLGKNHETGMEDRDRTRMSFDEVPQPPEVKDLDIPEIEKGPLFITVNKFKNALTTLSEMKHLVSDLESNVGSLENTLEEDRETEDALRNILEKTITDTEVIQDTVSPK